MFHISWGYTNWMSAIFAGFFNFNSYFVGANQLDYSYLVSISNWIFQNWGDFSIELII